MVQWFDSSGVNGLPDYSQMGALGKIGLALQNIADPNTIPKYQMALQAQEEKRFIQQQREEQVRKQSALAQLAADPNFNAMAPQQKYSALAAIDPSFIDDAMQFEQSQMLTPYQKETLALQRQQMAQAAASANRANLQLVQGQDGSISTFNPRTGQIERVQEGQNPFGQGGVSGGGVMRDGKPYAFNEEGKPLVGVLPVPGYTVAQGAVPSKEDAKAIKDIDTARRNLKNLSDRYRDAVKKYGSEYGGKGATELSGLKTDMAIELKTLQELGALAGPDMEILNSQIYDPTTIKANIRGIMPFATSPTSLVNDSLDRLNTTIDNKVSERVKSSGYKPIENGPKPGTIENGYRFKGGNPADKSNWEKI